MNDEINENDPSSRFGGKFASLIDQNSPFAKH